MKRPFLDYPAEWSLLEVKRKEGRMKFFWGAFSTLILILFSILFVFTFEAEAAENQLEQVAITIAAEACTDGRIGMHAVANTIANRAKRMKKTPYQVITQKNQYYGYTSPTRMNSYKGSCKKIAKGLAANIMNLRDITNGSEFNRQPKERVRRWHGKQMVRIGSHYFHRPVEG
jgi:spore germination cell wall hydrolase CwlJ-like protein